MYFLSLMSGTQPAAEDDAAWNMAVSNLIEVTQIAGHAQKTWNRFNQLFDLYTS